MPKPSLQTLLDELTAHEANLNDQRLNVLRLRELAESGERLHGQAIEYVVNLQRRWSGFLQSLTTVSQELDGVAAAVRQGELAQLRSLKYYVHLVDLLETVNPGGPIAKEATAAAVAAPEVEPAPPAGDQDPDTKVAVDMPSSAEVTGQHSKPQERVAGTPVRSGSVPDSSPGLGSAGAYPQLTSPSYRSLSSDLTRIADGRITVEEMIAQADREHRGKISLPKRIRIKTEKPKVSEDQSQPHLKSGPTAPPEMGGKPEPGSEPRPAVDQTPAKLVQADPGQNPKHRENEQVEENLLSRGLMVRLCAAIERGDFAGAYWLAVTGAPRIPSWVFQACFCAAHATRADSHANQQLIGIVNLHPDAPGDLRGGSGLSELDRTLLVALASMRPALLAPDDGIGLWLEEIQETAGPIAPILNMVLPFARQGVSLDPAFLEGEGDTARRYQQIQLCVAQTTRWQQTQNGANIKHPPTKQTLHQLISEASEIGRAVRIVAENRQDHVAVVQRVLREHMVNQGAIDREILRQAAQANPRITHLPSNLMESLRSKLLDVREYLKGWVEALVALPTANHDWRKEQTQTFHAGIDLALARAKAGLAEHIDRPLTKALTSAFLGMWDSFLCELRSESQAEADQERESAAYIRELRRPILPLTGVLLSEREALPMELPAAAVEELAGLRPTRTLREAMEQHVKARNYAMAVLICSEMETAEGTEALHHIGDANFEQEAAFRRAVAQLRHKLESAAIEHILLDHDRSALEGDVLSLEGQTFSGPTNFGPLYVELERLTDRINDFRRQRIDSLRQELVRLHSEVAALDGEVAEMAQPLLESAERSLANGVLALADEYLAQIEDLLYLGTGSGVDVVQYQSDAFDAFTSRFQPLYEALLDDSRTGRPNVLTALSRGEAIEGLLPALDLSGERQQEVTRAVEGYRGLKAKPDHRTEGRHALWVMSLLRFMGFESPDPERTRVERTWWQYRVTMTVGGLAPLPHFGSARNGLYDLLVVWGQPGPEGLDQIIEAAGVSSTCPLILYMGLFSGRERQDWGRHCFAKQTTALLVDELLVSYLATLSPHRLRSLVACSMPWGYANPYTPFGANVPEEMFKGRQPIIQDLISPHGATIIHGGRQLGKSAILRMIVRRFHDPDQERFVLYEDIRTLGDPTTDQPINELWRLIRDWAARHKLLSANVLDTGANVSNELLKVLERKPQTRILLLLDEADRFLEADSVKNFEEVGHLKRLMEASGRRIKVVLSGLHGVGRFCSIPNHPFAQFGTPINLKPLLPKEAQALVREPLETLGYRFESDDVVYRILAYTNYHPALLQHFCQQLLRPRRQSPPYLITLKTVEEIYRRREVRSVMRERFEWTVGLDARYEVLVYCMILDQLGERDGYRKLYSVSDVLQAVRAWSSTHAEVLSPEVSKSLLDELVGLAVLVRTDDGRYRLRNGNVVRALGSDTEIMEHLDLAIRKPLNVQHDPHKLRAALPVATGAWSPLTQADESALFRETVGFHMVFSSRALGLDHLDSAFRRLIRRSETDEDSGGVFRCPSDCTSISQLQSLLEHVIPAKDGGRFLICIDGGQLLRFGENPDQVVGEIQTLLQRRRSSRRRSVHVVAIFDPSACMAWFHKPAAEREAAQTRASSVAVCTPWGMEMVERYLNRHEMICTTDVVDTVFLATGGWPLLVEAMHAGLIGPGQEIPPHLDPRGAASTLQQRLLDPQAQDGEHFLNAVGGAALPNLKAVIMCVCENDGVLTRADLTPAFLGLDVTAEALRAEVETAVCMGILRDSGEALGCDPVVRRVLGV